MSPGHSLDIAIQRFASQAQAQVAFEVSRRDNPIEDFHGYSAYQEEYDNPAYGPDMPMTNRHHWWQADRWLIHVHSFDDTNYRLTPEPLKVSEEG